MNFARRYLAWVTIGPAAVAVPLAFLFLLQVLPLTVARGFGLALMLIAFVAASAAALNVVIVSCAGDVENALDGRGDISRAVSDCLQRTTRASLVIWPITGLTFAIAGTLLFMRSAMGFAYFIVAALLVAFPSAAWTYAAGKHHLVEIGSLRAPPPCYIGTQLSLRRKIALRFLASPVLPPPAPRAPFSPKGLTAPGQLPAATSS